MPSTSELENTLPLTAPAQTTTPEPITNILVYTITPLSSTQRHALIPTLHDYYATSKRAILAPDNFQTATLRDTYDDFLRTRESNPKLNPYLFIVADQADWANTGVLIVNLDAPTERTDCSSVVGVSRCSVDGDLGAEAFCNNLEIANMDWMDVKENEQSEWGGEDPYESPRWVNADGND